MSKRKICIVTGSRAEYGLLYWLMKEIREDHDLQLQIIATGMHLSPEFGLTYKRIEEDGFTIDQKVEMLLSSDSSVGMTKSVGIGVIGFADAFDALRPDIVVLLGDRFEAFSAAQAAMMARIPIAHLHGGEQTEGALDEAFRHSITKMSHLHFVAAEPYKNRVKQLGEHPEFIYNFGAPGLDYAKRLQLLSKAELEESLSFQFGEISFLVTYHPATLHDNSIDAVIELLKALDQFPEAKIIFTKSNADTGGRIINQLIEEYAERNEDRVKVFASLGQLKYLSAINYVDVVIGNSSSGIIEVPFFKKATVDIGDRQKGRLRAESIIHCEDRAEDIGIAIEKAFSRDFQQRLPDTKSLYGDGKASEKIKHVLKTINREDLMLKRFYNISMGE
ncbi:MAG TPA: UDP-N-acetylglucosamine 2-epimerase [Bacillales bacterium]|nr:UDP-N-acetylglucosamine 2-epimerase [Bacillales bacterium]